MMKKYLIFVFLFLNLFLLCEGAGPPIYWETPEYLSKDRNTTSTQYVYHWRREPFVGDSIVPLNLMPAYAELEEIYKNALLKYEGREELLNVVIPILDCLWNDVVFLSPIHPHKLYEELKGMGYQLPHIKFFKIPIDVLQNKRVVVWKWLDYPMDDPIHDRIESYSLVDLNLYQEMDALFHHTREFQIQSFNPERPSRVNLLFYGIPHILCQDLINISDPRITVIDWVDPI